MTAHGIHDALVSLDVSVRSKALRYQRLCLLSKVACNPVVYHLISERLRHGLKTYLPCDTFYTSAPHSYRGHCWILALCKPLQPVEELISVPFFSLSFSSRFLRSEITRNFMTLLGQSLITTSASVQKDPCPYTSKGDPCSPCRSFTAR